MEITRRQLNEIIDKKIDSILKPLSENKTVINESLFSKILVALNFGVPKHRKFRSYMKNYNICVKSCEKSFEVERSKYVEKSDSYSNLDSKVSDKDVKDTEKMTSEIIKNNPELGKCITRCRIMFLRSVVNLVKTEGDKICEKNKYEKTCKEWIESNIPELETELEYLEQAVMMLKRTKDNKKTQQILNKMNKSLVKK